MTVYNINLGIGWASSGVEYAQAYRAHLLRKQGISAKFIFTDFISHDNVCDLTRNIGFKDEEVIWLYQFFTDQPFQPTTFTLDKLKESFEGELTGEEVQEQTVKYFYAKEDCFLTAYLVKGSKDLVHRVEYVSRGKLIRKDYFTDRRFFTEYYAPFENRAQIYMRRFFHQDQTVAYEELITGDSSVFRLGDRLFLSKELFIAYFIEQLGLTEQDIVILDRATGTGQAVLSKARPAKIGVVVHAEHFSENAVTEHTILWNNFYEYTFSHADKIDFFITSTETQTALLREQFKQFTTLNPRIETIPVGSIDQLRYPIAKRRPYSLITASRLAGEKHVDWLAKAVIKARQTLPELTLDIYGAGGEESKIRQIITDNDAQTYINLCGHQDLTHIYQNYEVYLSASKSEGFGLTLLEAIGSGLPLIGFDVRYGNQTFIRDGQNGYLIPVFEADDEVLVVDALADKIIKLYQSNQLTDMQDISYEIASAYLTQVVEQQWRILVEDLEK